MASSSTWMSVIPRDQCHEVAEVSGMPKNSFWDESSGKRNQT